MVLATNRRVDRLVVVVGTIGVDVDLLDVDDVSSDWRGILYSDCSSDWFLYSKRGEPALSRSISSTAILYVSSIST